jgi:PEP-CTERM motif
VNTTALFSATAGLVLALTLTAAPRPAAAQSFTLWVTETPAGGTAPYNNQFLGGVRSYTFDGLGYGAGNYSAGPLIAASGLDDPSDVLVAANGDLLISNRSFNTGPGSVARVSFSGDVPSAPVLALANIDTGPHQSAVTASGGLVVSSLNSGGKLYPGVSAPSSVSFASGTQRGTVAFGNRLYTTNASNGVQVFDLGSGAPVGGSFSVAGAGLLHYGTMFGGSLYLADIGANGNGAGGGVFKVVLDAAGAPVSSSRVASVDGAIAVSFSPIGDEMFVASHFGGTITGFAVSGGTVAAASNLLIDGGTLASWNGAHVQYGGLAVTGVVPEPASWALLLGGIGFLAAVWMRRSLPREGKPSA